MEEILALYSEKNSFNLTQAVVQLLTLEPILIYSNSITKGIHFTRVDQTQLSNAVNKY